MDRNVLILCIDITLVCDGLLPRFKSITAVFTPYKGDAHRNVTPVQDELLPSVKTIAARFTQWKAGVHRNAAQCRSAYS